MPIMTTLLASGGILLAGLTGIHPATSPAPHVETAASASVASTAAVTTRLDSVFLFSSSVTSVARPVVEGLATAGATITINDAAGTDLGHTVADASGMFSVQLTSDLKPGYNELGLKQALNGATSVSPASVTYSK